MGTYKPNQVKLKWASERNARKEIEYVINHSVQSMEEWADQDLNLDLSDEEIKERMRKSNNTHTLSMLSSIYSPCVESGFKMSSFFSMMFMRTAFEKINPNFNMDVARLEASWLYNVDDADHPKMKGIKKLIQEDYMSRTNVSINEHLKNHDMGSLVMTPMHLAAIKCSFDKQAYVAYRKCKTMDEINAVEKKYDKAIQCVKSVAQNSGFDMSVVAAEERYIVGLKIRHNPDYANMYYETYNMGAEPDFNYDRAGNKKSRVWNGIFKTVDGGDYTVGNHKDKGAFTPRKPYGVIMTNRLQSKNIHLSVDPKDRICEHFVVRGKEWGGAMRFIQSDDCKFSDDVKKQLVSKIQSEINYQRDSLISAMLDDKVFKSKAEGREYWDKSFGKAYNDMVKLSDDALADFDRPLSTNGQVDGVRRSVKDINGNTIRGYFDEDGEFKDGPIVTRNTYSQAMRDEMKRITVKTTLADANLDFGKGTAIDMLKIRREIGEHYKRVYVQNGENWHDSDIMKDVPDDFDKDKKQDIFGQRMLDKMYEKTMSNMSADEALELVRHAVVNVDQGRKRRDVPGRVQEEDWLTNNKTYDELKRGSYLEEWRAEQLANDKPRQKGKGSSDKSMFDSIKKAKSDVHFENVDPKDIYPDGVNFDDLDESDTPGV